MAEWVADEACHGGHRTVIADTYGEAVEQLFPAVCCQVGWSSLLFNVQQRGPLVMIDEDTGRFEVWSVRFWRETEDLADRIRDLAVFAEACADDLEDIDDDTERRDAKWARKALDEIAAGMLADAHTLEVLEEEEALR